MTNDVAVFEKAIKTIDFLSDFLQFAWFVIDFSFCNVALTCFLHVVQ